MKYIPKSIWLNIGDGVPDDADFRDLEEVTWSEERMFDSDIEYIRQSEWISVGDRMPPGTTVLLCASMMQDVSMALCVFIKGRFMIYDRTFKYDKEFYPTHWMLIPKLPKTDNK